MKPIRRSAKPIARKRERARLVRDRAPRPKDSAKPSSVIRLTGDALEELREIVWTRDKHHCVKCGKWVPLDADDPFLKMDLAHIISRGAGGSDTVENCVTSCHECHMKSHNCEGKPVPAKERDE